MYITALTLHSYIRWLVLLTMLAALIRAWWGLLAKRQWTKVDDWSVMAFTLAISLQFVLGVILFLVPDGLAAVARMDFGGAMKTRELRFFGLEHPLQMFIAVFVSHLGSARARKAAPSARQFRWAAICFTISALLILVAIPWWRPFVRGF